MAPESDLRVSPCTSPNWPLDSWTLVPTAEADVDPTANVCAVRLSCLACKSVVLIAIAFVDAVACRVGGLVEILAPASIVTRPASPAGDGTPVGPESARPGSLDAANNAPSTGVANWNLRPDPACTVPTVSIMLPALMMTEPSPAGRAACPTNSDFGAANVSPLVATTTFVAVPAISRPFGRSSMLPP